MQEGKTKGRVESRILSNEGQSVVEELNRVIDRVLAPTPRLVARPEVALVRVQVADRALRQPTFLQP